MNNATLYNQCNVQQTTSASKHLEEFMHKIEWKKDSRVLDIGCGDGSVTNNVLKKSVPNCKKVTGCDINKDMIDFAKEHFASEDVDFIVLDISSELPDYLRGQFHHAFSFYVMHWVQNQQYAFKNIYDMLKIGGDCLIAFVAQATIFDAYKILAQNNRWREWIHGVERFISPYHEARDPIDKLRQIVLKAGFSKTEIQYRRSPYKYATSELFRGGIRAIIPFAIPEEHFEDFLDDLFDVMQQVDIEKYNNEKSTPEFVHNFSLFLLYMKK
ncbi:unnamed protein product [Leptosia nina]|uniref:Methyltransferase domain-containing protein n=1 Tax=Leptosia nina TaxID=320188 RepID=A0AAV1ITV2_9NEOP